MRKFKCPACKKELSCTNAVWKERAAKYGSVDKMKKKYLCRDCRKTVKVKKAIDKFSIEELITRNDDFKALKSKLKAQVRSVKLLGTKDQGAMRRFSTGVKSTMDDYKITNYEFNIVHDDLKSIIITNIPFIDKIEINIEE